MTRFERHVRELADEVGVAELRLHSDLGRMDEWDRKFSDCNDSDPVGAACSDGRIMYYRGDVFAAAPWVQVFNFKPRSPAAYFCALHEIGHVDLRHLENGYGERGDTHMINCEAEAWTWALDHALIEPDKRTISLIRTAWLGSYRRWRGPGTNADWERMATLTGLPR